VTQRSQRAQGALLVFLAAIAWSAAGIGIKSVHASPLAIAGFRSLFALPVMLVALLVSARGNHALIARVLRARDVWLAAAAYALTVTSFVVATRWTTAANAILLQYTAPIWVALLSGAMLGERMRRLDWAAVAGCLFGMTWFFRDQVSASGLRGNVVAVVSGIGFAGLPLFLRRHQRTVLAGGRDDAADLARISPLVAISIGNVLSVLACIAWMPRGAPSDVRSWWILVALGTVQIGLAYILYGAGVRRVRAVDALLLATVEPVLNPLWVAIGTGERPTHSVIVGGAIVVASVTVKAVVREE